MIEDLLQDAVDVLEVISDPNIAASWLEARLGGSYRSTEPLPISYNPKHCYLCQKHDARRER